MQLHRQTACTDLYVCIFLYIYIYIVYRATCIVNDGFGWVEIVLFRDCMFIGNDSYNNNIMLSHICQAKCHVCQTIIKCGLTNCQIKQFLVLEIGSCFGKFQYNIRHNSLTFNRNFFLRSTQVNLKEMHDNPPLSYHP